MNYEKGLSALQMLEDLIALKSKNNNKKPRKILGIYSSCSFN